VNDDWHKNIATLFAGFWLDGGNVDMVRARLIRRNTVNAIPTRSLAQRRRKYRIGFNLEPTGRCGSVTRLALRLREAHDGPSRRCSIAWRVDADLS
jgi:hypothetical protein